MKTSASRTLLLTLLLLAASLIATTEVLATTDKDGSGWTITARDYDAPYVGAPMANGRIGLLPWREPFSVRHVVLNHVFDLDREHGITRVVQGINPFGLSMSVDGRPVSEESVSQWRQTIDMRQAEHQTHFVADGAATVDYSVCALRGLPYAGLITVRVTARRDLTLSVANTMTTPDGLTDSRTQMRDTWADGVRTRMLQTVATTQWLRKQVAASSIFLFDGAEQILPTYADSTQALSFSRSLRKGETFAFALFGSICSSRDFLDPVNEAERQTIYAQHEGTAALLARHHELWRELWKGDIEIEGDPEAQQAVRFALFNLYSSCREGSRLSVAPMGLSSRGYNGHVFWDTEMWMYPPLLLLNEGIARSMVDYRTDRLAAARRKAEAYGYLGAMYPWESDDAGEECTPTTALTGPFEHHVTADVAIAAWNYFCVSRDTLWLRETGQPLLREVADYWLSRSTREADGSFSIRNVVGANEYRHGAVNNAFTNGSAILALRHSTEAARLCGAKADPRWQEVADGLRIERFPDGTTRENADYRGEMIKQSDANLLGYPLCLVTDTAAQRRDMDYYAERIDPENGPAMSYSVFCVQYARMGDARRAYEMFLRSYRPNLRAPFGVIAETATSQNPYFMTGAGGLLQAVINGFGGLQVTDAGIVQLSSVLPEHWRRLTITGVGPEHRTYVREGRRH